MNACKFCKQIGNLAEIMQTEGNGVEAATLNCNCHEARQYQARSENIRRLGEALEEFKEYSSTHNIKLEKSAVQMLSTIGAAVIDRQVCKNSMTFGRVSIGFALSGKGNLLITFKYAEAQKFEI